MAIDNLPTSDESRLSGAYIRTLVKQLTTSKPTHTTKDDTITLLTNDSILVGHQQYTTTQPTIIPINNENNKISNNSGMAKPKIQNPQGQHKKQIRRRLHTSRPYQERLLNMAEARKEIVTALKFHRASMKQASEKKQQQQQQQLGQSLGEPNTIESLLPFTNPNVMVDNNFCYYPSYNNNNNINNNNNCYNHWVNSSIPIIEQPKTQETLNIIPLPNQTLGLNLNLKAFANLDTTFGHNNVSSIITPSSSTSTRRRPMSSITPRDHGESTTSVVVGQGGGGGVVVDNMHQSLDEHEMENIRSIGEQHQIVWDDTLDLVKWFKFVKGGVEFGNNNNNNNNNIKGCNNDNNNINNNDENNNEYISFEEFPPWLSGNDDQSFLQPQHLEESSSEGTSLPWVDIGEIDGMDDEWLS